MNITVNGQDLMRQLAFLNCVKSGSPDEMLIDTVGDNLLRLAVSCQETTASAVLPIVSSSGEMPQPSVSVARLRRVKLAPMAKLELNHQGIRLTSGESHYWLSSTNSSLLQKKLACAPFSEQYTVGGEVLNLVRRVRKASARREANKYRMAGVWVELAESRIYVRASNGFQAMEACMPHKPTPKQEFFLPNKAVAPLLQMLPSSGTCALRIGISEKSIAFHAQERTLQVQRLLGNKATI